VRAWFDTTAGFSIPLADVPVRSVAATYRDPVIGLLMRSTA
jgi:hypothetical protein